MDEISKGRPGFSAVRSPCTSVCRIDARTGWCEGCMRTIDEIASWGTMSDAQRLDVWARLGERRRQTAATPPGERTSVPVSGAAAAAPRAYPSEPAQPQAGEDRD